MDTEPLFSSTISSSAGPICSLLLLVAIVIWSSHSISHRLPFLTEGSLALLFGLFSGGGFFLYFEGHKGSHIPAELVAFNYDLYMYLLCPIIFYAGFSIKKKHFFANIGALATLGVAGTILLATVLAIVSAHALHKIGLDTHNIVGNALALGVIFSSTDSVAALQAIDGGTYPQLHALVFGEAVVNDATAIVLLKAVQNIRTEAQLTWTAFGFILKSFIQLSISSMILGVTIGLVCAFILKHSFTTRHSTDHEVSLLAALGFLSYLLAEWCNLSGVFSTFFCGLTLSHYGWHSLSPSAKVASVHAFRVLSFLAELCMFLSCGLDLWGNRLWHKDVLTKKRSLQKIVALVCWISISVPVARFVVALPLLAVVNTFRKPGQSITWRNKLAVSWAGCARGAVTLALAVNHFLGSDEDNKDKNLAEESEENRIIAAAAMFVIVLSTVVLGGATPLIFTQLLEGDGEKKASEVTSHHQPNTTPLTSSLLTAPLLDKNTTPATAPRLPSSVQNIINSTTTTTNPREENDEDGDILGISLHSKWTALDKRVFQPLFGGRSYRRSSFRRDEGDLDVGGGQLNQHNDMNASRVPSPFESTHQNQQQRREHTGAAVANMDVEVGAAAAAPFFPLSRRLSSASFGRVDSGVLEELFTHPGRSRRGRDLDREVEEDGLVQQAEEFLEN